MLLSASTSCFAFPIQMRCPDVGDYNYPHKAPALLPTVDYTDGILTIQSSYLLSDVTVIIRDSEGAVLYTYIEAGDVTTSNADITLKAKEIILDSGTEISIGSTLKTINP